jgi:beta-glucosidase
VLPVGATNIKVASTSGFYVGQVITIDTGASQETATITSVGSSGPDGSGLDLAPPLSFEHADGAPVTGSGTGEVPLTNDFPAYPAYSGEEWAARLDDAVLRILTQMNKAGLLEGTQYGSQSNGCDRAAGIDCVPFVPQRPDLQAIQPDEFEKAQLIAERSATLLKNETGLLPLSCDDLTTGNGVVLMGPTSISTYTGGGGSAHVRPYDSVESTYDALIAAATAKCGEGVTVSYVPGYDLNGPIVPSSVLSAPDGQPGLLRQQITRDSDEPVLAPGGAPDQVDPTVNYNWTNPLPANTAWRWTGVLTAPSDGSYALRVYAAYQDSAQLYVDGSRRINMGSYGPYFPDSMSNSYATNTVANKLQDPDFQNGQRGTSNLTFSAGQQVSIDLRIVTSETMDTNIQFRWIPTTNDADQIAIAEAAAAGANKTLYFAYNEGSEGSDRGGNAIANGLALAGNQDDVITAVAAASPNTVVVLNTGDMVFMPWESAVNAILQMWYPGQMGGPATADVVLGNVNPSGKSPITFPDALAPIGQRFPQDTQPVPCADNSGGSSYYGDYRNNIAGNCPLYPGIYTMGFLGEDFHSFRTINYTTEEFGGVQGNGIFQGYRWFDVNGFEPLFPFGHGLSYTTFEYRNLVLKAEKDGTVRVSFIVQNKGDVAGAVVPQVYVGSAPSIPAYAQQAVRALRGFDRVELRPNESKRVEITLDPRSFQFWDEVAHAWTFLGGERTIWVGDSSRDLRLWDQVTPMQP